MHLAASAIFKLYDELKSVVNAFVAYGGWVPRNMGGGGGGLELLNPNPSSRNT